MELRYRREAAVGVLIIVGVAVFVFLLMWLRGRSFREGNVVRVVFDDVAGLKEGDPVRTSGVLIGHVSRIRLASPGNVDVWFSLERAPVPREDAMAEIRAADLFGARYIEYFPGRSARPLRGTIRGTRIQDVTEMASRLGGEGRELLGATNDATHELRSTLIEARRLLQTLNAGSASATHELTGALEELRHAMHRLDLVMAENGPVVGETMRSMQGASANLDRLTAQLTRTSTSLDSIVGLVSRGHGLAGALINDTTLVGELRATNTALRELLVDLKANPGRYIRLRL